MWIALSSSRSSQDRLIGPLSAKCWPEAFRYLGSQVAADGGCERDMVRGMNSGEGG